MKIISTPPGQIHNRLNATPEKTAAPVNVATPAKAPASNGTLSDAQSMLRAMPEVDMAFVSAMQEAIVNDQLPVDSAALAKSMMEFFR